MKTWSRTAALLTFSLNVATFKAILASCCQKQLSTNLASSSGELDYFSGFLVSSQDSFIFSNAICTLPVQKRNILLKSNVQWNTKDMKSKKYISTGNYTKNKHRPPRSERSQVSVSQSGPRPLMKSHTVMWRIRPGDSWTLPSHVCPSVLGFVTTVKLEWGCRCV